MTHTEIHEEQIMFNCSKDIDKYKCRTCSDYQTDLLASLKRHIKAGHRATNSEQQQIYKCLKCFFMTHSFYPMGQHSLFSECATRNEDERKERFVCCLPNQPELVLERCSSNLNLNSESHFECEHCLSKFKTKQNLKTHVIACHTKPEDIPWYNCSHCSYRCKRKDYLKQHKLRHSKQEDIGWYDCPHCSYKSKHNAYLKKHIKRNHCKPEDIQWLHCEQCSSKFRTKDEFQKHFITRHTKPDDILWYNCPHCPYKSKLKRELKRHIKLHHSKQTKFLLKPEDIQWHDCPHCLYKCKRKGDLKRHVTSHHSKPEEI